jgi:hypothetical protein
MSTGRPSGMEPIEVSVSSGCDNPDTRIINQFEGSGISFGSS